MSIENLITQIKTFGEFSDHEFEIIKSKFNYNKFKSKEYMLKEGQVSTHLHFVALGLVAVNSVRGRKHPILPKALILRTNMGTYIEKPSHNIYS